MTVYISPGLTGVSGNFTAGQNLIAGGAISAYGSIFFANSNGVLAEPAGATTPVNSTLWFLTGVPAVGVGSNGDYALRFDGTEALHTLLYHKEAGAWVATAA